MSDGYKRKMTALFEGRLDPADFSHADHIGVAYESLRTYAFMEAVERMNVGIREMSARAGLADKFNATITFAFMSLIGERMAGEGQDGPEAFLEKNRDLLQADIIGSRYSNGRLHSALARTIPLLPDRAQS